MKAKTVLLLCGGGGAEHEISLVSANFLETELDKIEGINLVKVEITKDAWWLIDSSTQAKQKVGFDINSGQLLPLGISQTIDYAIPCIHGFLGETGDIQSLLTMANIPFLGCDSEASRICFNKITAKLWFNAIGIKNTPYVALMNNDAKNHQKAIKAFMDFGGAFVKAASQGSSVGCYLVTDEALLHQAIDSAFSFSEQVLIEKPLSVRELEVAAYEYDGELIITYPGEVLTPELGFYTFDEKYSDSSQSTTHVMAQGLTEQQVDEIKTAAQQSFTQLKLKDLARIDFFLTSDGEIMLNEINTLPGMTPISMFPKMLNNHGHQFHQFLAHLIKRATESSKN